jgi:hypothetical protein
LISFCWLPSRFWCVLWSTSIDAIIYFYGTFVWFSFGLIWHQIWFQYIDPFGLSIFKLGSQKSYAWNNIIWNSKTIWSTWIPLPSSMTLHQHLEFIVWMMSKLVFELESHAQEVSLGVSSLLFQFQSMFTSLEYKAFFHTISLCIMYQKVG